MRSHPYVQRHLCSSFEVQEKVRQSSGKDLPHENASSEEETRQTSSEVRPPRTVSASHIRSRFLNSLGIVNPNEPQQHHQESTHPIKGVGPNSFQRRKRSESFNEPLKGDYGMPDDELSVCSRSAAPSVTSSSLDSASSSYDTSSYATCKQRTAVSFDPCVTVVPIPSRKAYSDRIKCHLWTPIEELNENAARNYVEFAAENWDWKQVAEEEDMVDVHGEYIHPVHFVGRPTSLREHLMTVISVQQQAQPDESNLDVVSCGY